LHQGQAGIVGEKSKGEKRKLTKKPTKEKPFFRVTLGGVKERTERYLLKKECK